VIVSDFVPESAPEIPRTPYANEIATHLGQDHIDRLTDVFAEIGVADWLERHPFSRLEIMHQVWDEGVAVNGVYFFQDRLLKIATTRAKSEYGQRFEWQRVYSVSSTAETQIEATQMTLVHELGHHIHNILAGLDEQHFLETTRTVFLRGGTTYSKQNPLEYFAESFALYSYFPTELLVKDVDGYVMIEGVLERIGLEVKQR
jgi:hypothetical protein